MPDSLQARAPAGPPLGSTVALVVAAGRGKRAASGSHPKQYVEVSGRAVLAHTLVPLLAHRRIDYVLVVRHADDQALYEAAVAPLLPHAKLLASVSGGVERQDSVRLGLAALRDLAPSLVLIHDAARPYVTAEMLDRLFKALGRNAAAILASPMTDTVKRVEVGGLIQETIPRETLWRAETPQAFRYHDIAKAHDAAAQAKTIAFTDDASVLEWAGLPVAVVDSGGLNGKITWPEDLAMAEARLGTKRGRSVVTAVDVPDVRTGQGFDVHKFKPGDHIWLCGVRLKHTHGVDAHSDGDVGLHALTDALLGAIGDGDIGQHFKNTDPRWKDAASDQFLADALRRVKARGGVVTNVDVTVLSEAPKIAPHRDAMRKRIAEILELDVSRVSVKATTTETLGFTGRREGLAALATATVILR
jgi:2-C-methyl-D-erythritol 4-phosphate cytidylyltransferase / 2-C-methyl-D-erythritol 2,4-cyclodiphosphate synthase